MKVFIVDDKDNLNEFKIGSRKSNAYAFNSEPDKRYRHKSQEPLTQSEAAGDPEPEEKIDQDENAFEFDNRSSIVVTTNTTQQSQNGIR